MKRIGAYVFAGLTIISSFVAFAGNESPQSGSEISSLGTVSAVIGLKDKEISGVFHFVQIEMPDRSFHADCKIFFSGKLSSTKAIPIHVAAINTKKIVNGTLTFNGYMKFAKNLPVEQSFKLVLAENLPNCTDEIDALNSDFGFQINKLGNWRAVNIVNTKRAYFYNEPFTSAKGKAFLVAGDVLYIYDENPEWYYVKFQGDKKDTVGWIKKSDTIQFLP
jgi:hypothetical protein